MAEEHDVGAELAGLRREIFEMRNLVIKTDNLLKTFHLELKDVARKQADSERRHYVGHVTGYVAMAVVALGGALLYGNAVGSSAREDAEERLAAAERAQAQAQEVLNGAKQRAAAQEQANAEAQAAWQLVTSSDPVKQDEGLVRAAKLDTAALSTFTRMALEYTTATIRENRAAAAFAAGFAEQRSGDARKAAAAFERYLAIAQQMPATWQANERLQAAYQLGALYNQLGEHAKAVTQLQKYVAEGSSPSAKAYAFLLLGDSLEATERPAEATQAYRAGLALGPTGATASMLKRRLGEAPS